MSLVVTRDVFCDGINDADENCINWTNGYTGAGKGAFRARRAAAREGWATRTVAAPGGRAWGAGRDPLATVDLCPACLAAFDSVAQPATTKGVKPDA